MEFGRGFRAVSDVHKVELRHVPQYHRDGQVLGHQVRAVDLARDLGQGDHLLGALLLEPQAINVNVADLGDALPVKDALGGRGIDLQDDADG